MLQQEYLYFRQNFDEILKEHKEKFVLIKDQKVQGAFDLQIDAYLAGIERFGEDSGFLISKASLEQLNEVRRFHSRVYHPPIIP